MPTIERCRRGRCRVAFPWMCRICRRGLQRTRNCSGAVVGSPLSCRGRSHTGTLAVTGSERLPALPKVPSLSETGVPELKGIDSYTFYGLVGPAGMPSPDTERINDAVNKVSTMPDVVSRMRDVLFYEPATGSPAAFRQYLEKEVAKWREVGKTIKIDWSRG
jgi:Tripartite tricarboxylate transporter family receptor